MKHRKTLLTMFALLLALALGGCGGGADSGSAVSNGAASTPAGQSQSEPAEPSGSTSAPAEGADVTARYQEQLTGCYGGEHDMAYRFAEEGKLTVAVQGEDGYELTDGSWWVWQEGDTTYLYTNLEETAHPARYTFERSDKGVLSLYDDTTGELSDLLTPYTCGVFP